MTLCDTVIFL
uniref:Uncharacterized protein n=1 Tax=Lepeophtheirus salmonis TaxID=72036 RepID=A0A0K2T5Z3_LEPSM